MAEEIITKNRDQVVSDYKRSYSLRLPDADTRDGMQPDVNARCCADMVMPLYANAKRLGRGLLITGRFGDELDEAGEQEGVPRLEARGASGFVLVATATGGAWAYEGDELTEPESGLIYQCTKTAHYSDQSQVPVSAADTGPSTNQAADVVLQWSAPRYGMDPTTTVVEQSDGSGLSGGTDVETDDAYVARIIEARAQRSNSGNDAEYQRQSRLTPGVAVEQAFTYPAILGPGTIGLTFTLKPQATGGSRAPNAAQLAEVEAWLRGQFPADDGLVMCSLLDEDLTVSARIKWSATVDSWADTVQWPPFYEIGGTPGAVIISGSPTSATTFTVSCDGADYTGVAQPVAGQSFGLFDATHGRFSRKKILSFTGTGPWVVTCDTAQSATDTSYVPVDDQRLCPWSESLTLLVAPALDYLGRMGPGEQVATPPLDGQRQTRSPLANPSSWPHIVGNRIEVDLLIDAVDDVEIVQTTPSTTTVGTPGVSSYLLRLAGFALFPWS